VFEVITDPAVLLPKLFATENDNSPLADHRITYQPRDSNRDLQADLKAALNRSRYLLITAPTGYGKTREAGMLAQTMMLEGWRVLRIKNTGWLDVPKTLPEELNNNRSRVLILLDDLNGLFSTGERTESPRTEKIPLLREASYHDRLLQVLDILEGMCTESEIRVLATARSEADQWKLLKYDENDKLWKRFERLEIPEPTDSAIVNLLEDSTKQVDLKANPDEFEVIAHKSDGTYRNILLNLRRWRAQNKEISKDDFTETLNGSWREIYERTVNKRQSIKYIYDAIDLLSTARINLYIFLVDETAAMLWGGNWIQRLFRLQNLRHDINYLTNDLKILPKSNNELNPHDGQIDAKGFKTPYKPHIQYLQKLLFDWSGQRRETILKPLLGFSDFLMDENENGFQHAEIVLRKAINLEENSPGIYLSLGIAIGNQNRHAEAEKEFHKATELDPKNSLAYCNLGLSLQYQNRFEEAEAAYHKAIEFDPEGISAYINLGGLTEALGKHIEAEAIFRQVIEIDPKIALAYHYLGLSLQNQNRLEEAEAAYRKAIELDPNIALVYNNLGLSLQNQNRLEEAEAAYRKAVELDPNIATAYNNLGSLLQNQNRLEEVEAAYRKAIELDPNIATAYNNLGLLLQNQNRLEEAEVAYRKVIEFDPKETSAHVNLGKITGDLGKHAEAEAIFRQVIEIDPKVALA
jgi:tetratricopeptide (TPR) repeat protein